MPEVHVAIGEHLVQRHLQQRGARTHVGHYANIIGARRKFFQEYPSLKHFFKIEKPLPDGSYMLKQKAVEIPCGRIVFLVHIVWF